MVAGVLFLALVNAQKSKIDFECRATSLSNALGKLSRITGTQYRAEPLMAQEIVCISAKNVEIDNLITKIAETTSCRWKEDNGVQVLYRPKEVTDELNAKDIEDRIAYLNKLFEPRRKELAKLKEPYERAKGFVEAMAKLKQQASENPRGLSLDGPRLASPASILALQLMLDTDPKLIAAAPEGETVTFSNKPTSAQLPLGKNAQQYIKEYIETETQLGGMLDEQTPAGPASGILDDVFRSAKMADGVGKVHFTIRRSGRITSFGTTVYTELGKVRSWGFTNTYSLGDDPWKADREAGANDKPQWIPLSEGSALLDRYQEEEPDVAHFAFEVDRKPWETLPNTLKKILQTPDEIDPLSLSTTDGCLAIAEQNSTPLIAYLADANERAGRLAAKDGKLNLTRFKALLKVSSAQIDNENGWTTIKPRNALYATRYRLSRPAFARFMKSVIPARSITLESYSRFHYEAGLPLIYSSIARLYRKTLTKYGASEIADIDSHSPEAYRCLGALTQAQWKSLLDGESVRVGDGTLGLRKTAEAWMKNGPIGLILDPKANLPEIYENWTEYSPLGLPIGANMVAGFKPVQALDLVTKVQMPDGSLKEDVMGMGRGWEASEIAKSWAKGGHYKTFEQLKTSLANSNFQYTERSDLKVVLYLLPTHRLEEVFLGAPTTTKRMPYDQLPENVRKDFEEAFKRELKSGGSD